METTLLSSSWRDWLVVGSNGAIGSELTKALFLECSRKSDCSLHRIQHSHGAYASIARKLVHRRGKVRRPLRLLFCGGKGGFSLSRESGEEQREAFRSFCEGLDHLDDLDKFIYVSSLGAHCSRIQSTYSSLIWENEQVVRSAFGRQSLILRFPSMYGYNQRERRYHGLVGVIFRNLRIRCPTRVYARLETRRNYLSIHRLAPLLVRDKAGGGLLDERGEVNIQSTMSLSVFDVCTHFFRAIKQRPTLKLVQHSALDEEHHYPSALAGAKFCINDPIGEWVSLHWKRSAPSSLL